MHSGYFVEVSRIDFCNTSPLKHRKCATYGGQIRAQITTVHCRGFVYGPRPLALGNFQPELPIGLGPELKSWLYGPLKVGTRSLSLVSTRTGVLHRAHSVNGDPTAWCWELHRFTKPQYRARAEWIQSTHLTRRLQFLSCALVKSSCVPF